MSDSRSAQAAKNLAAWAEIPDLCLAVRRAVLAQSIPSEQFEARVFAEIRERACVANDAYLIGVLTAVIRALYEQRWDRVADSLARGSVYGD